MLTTAMDNDFLFRTTLSDLDQGPVLAKITLELGYGNVGMIYRDDVWGRGIADAFENAWEGKLIRVAADPENTTLVEELRESRGVLDDTQALIVLAFQPQQETIVREALDNGFYNVFILGPTGRSLDLIRSIGPEHLAGMIGTSPGAAQDTPSAIAWEDGYKSAYGSNPPPFPYVKQTYDATVALALATQAAGKLEGAAIRDQLRTIGRPPGELVIAQASSIANGLRGPGRRWRSQLRRRGHAPGLGRERRSCHGFRRGLAIHPGRYHRSHPGRTLRPLNRLPDGTECMYRTARNAKKGVAHARNPLGHFRLCNMTPTGFEPVLPP